MKWKEFINNGCTVKKYTYIIGIQHTIKELAIYLIRKYP